MFLFRNRTSNPSAEKHRITAKNALAQARKSLLESKRHYEGGDSSLAFRSALMAHASAAMAYGEAMNAGEHEMAYQAMEVGRQAEHEIRKGSHTANPSRHPNAYIGDAVARAQYKKAREAWERGGRRGPPPPKPNPDKTTHAKNAQRTLEAGLAALDNARRMKKACQSGSKEQQASAAYSGFHDAYEAHLRLVLAGAEFDMVGMETEAREAGRQAQKAFDLFLMFAKGSVPGRTASNPAAHVHRGAGGDLIKQADHYLELAEKAEEAEDMGKAWDATRHAECDLRMAYAELAYAGGASSTELAKLESVYDDVKAQKDRLRKARSEGPKRP